MQFNDVAVVQDMMAVDLLAVEYFFTPDAGEFQAGFHVLVNHSGQFAYGAAGG